MIDRIGLCNNPNLRVRSFDRCSLDFTIANKFVLSFGNLVHFPLDDGRCVTMLDISFINAAINQSLSLSVLLTMRIKQNFNVSFMVINNIITYLFFILFGHWHRNRSRLNTFLPSQSFLSFASQTNFAFNRRLFRPTECRKKSFCLLVKKPNKCTNNKKCLENR